MTRFKQILTKEQYEKLSTMNYRERHKELEDNILNIQILCGYGFYGASEPAHVDDEYFIMINIGDSCD